MTDVAAPAAPAAAPSGGAPANTNGAAPPSSAPRRGLYATDSWHEFQELLGTETPPSNPSVPNSPEPKGLEKAVPKPAHLQQQSEVPEPKPGEPANDNAPKPDDSALPDGKTPEMVAAEDKALLEKARAWMASERLPDELMDRLVEVPGPNGTSKWEPFKDALKAVMRQSDYSREMGKIKTEREEWSRKDSQNQAFYEAISHPEEGGKNMYEIFTRNGQRKQLRQAAEMLAHEEQEDIDYANGAGYAVMMRMRIQDPNDYRVQDAISKARTERERWREHGHQTRARDFQIQQLEAQQQARVDEAAQTEVRATIDNQMAQLRPRAFKAIGIPDNALNDQRLRAHMGAIARQQGLAKVTPELVMDAARALREEIDDERRAANTNGTPPAATPKPFTPSLGAGGAGKISGAQKRNGSTVEEFGEKWGVRGW